ncbi:MAG: peptidase dimerization domain-containing protein, partial [Acidobacteriota bacterium]
GATGIVWLKLHFRTKGAHTLRSRDEPSAVLAAARAIERISALPMRRSPDEMETWINIGMIGGGDVPNAQARDAWFTVDLRSNDPDSLTRLEDRVLTIGEQTAHAIGVRFDHETMHRMNGGRILGSESSTLVMMARRSLRAAGWESVDVTLRGTADHNVAIRHGIPGIAIGMTTGGGAHTPTEYADTAPLTTGIKQLLLLVLSPLTR